MDDAVRFAETYHSPRGFVNRFVVHRVHIPVEVVRFKAQEGYAQRSSCGILKASDNGTYEMARPTARSLSVCHTFVIQQ